MNSKKAVKFIVNPFSGVNKKGQLKKQLDQHLDHSQFDFEVQYTEAPHHATILSQNAINEGFDIVVAVGGDGSINEVAKALIDSPLTLGILPAGSGNGFARHLGLQRNIPKAIQQFNHGKKIRIDTCMMNDQPFINLAGVGFDGWVANRLKISKLRGFWGYFRFITQDSFSYQQKRFTVCIDGKKVEEDCLCVEVANAPMFGYNFEVAPQAKFNDGILEVVLVKKMSPLKFPLLAWHSFRKSIHTSNLTTCFSGKKIEIEIKEKTAAHFDGEGIMVNENLHFSIKPLSLSLRVPNN